MGRPRSSVVTCNRRTHRNKGAGGREHGLQLGWGASTRWVDPAAMVDLQQEIAPQQRSELHVVLFATRSRGFDQMG